VSKQRSCCIRFPVVQGNFDSALTFIDICPPLDKKIDQVDLHTSFTGNPSARHERDDRVAEFGFRVRISPGVEQHADHIQDIGWHRIPGRVSSRVVQERGASEVVGGLSLRVECAADMDDRGFLFQQPLEALTVSLTDSHHCGSNRLDDRCRERVVPRVSSRLQF